MQDGAGGGGLSDQAQPTSFGAPPNSRNRHRVRGWIIAVATSAVLWGGVVWVAWTLVRALT